ncbi:MAG: imelysin family protein [Bacteroidota bacterium]
MKKFNLILICFFAVLFVLFSCEQEEVDPVIITETVTVTDTITVTEQSIDALKEGVQANYADLVYTNYLDSYNAAFDMQQVIQAFTADPTDATLEAAKVAWLEAREPYGQTEAFRFASGPIDADDGPEGLLNAWPLDESYIDYVEGNPTTGIINNTAEYPTLDKALLESLNEEGGEENISIGYHAIEFLLWGQDLTDPSALQTGNRPVTDFTTADNADRRLQYLNITAELILDHLQLMLDEWDPNGSGNYRSQFMALSTDDAITNILTGIGTLCKSELAGERIFTAYDNINQEDEHSCFSDNTHRDTRLNAIGIRNVYTGCYIRTDGISKVAGPSLVDLMNVLDSDFSNEANELMNEALAAVEATAIPFDFAISDNDARPAVLEAVNKLRTFGDKLAEVGAKLGLTINTDLPG